MAHHRVIDMLNEHAQKLRQTIVVLLSTVDDIKKVADSIECQPQSPGSAVSSEESSGQAKGGGRK